MAEAFDALSAALADRYTLQRELGRGGMATVYLATDAKHHRPVAIKVLKPELAHALGPERFLREIELTAQLHHPNILPLYDSGKVAAGQGGCLLYYVMPYVEGESLRDRLTREKQLPLEDALQITKDVAEGLGYAHSRGVIHRDIKPENILLESGRAVVADFGVAKAVSAAGGTKLTETGLAIGTPAYMSPEQGSGAGDLDVRSDLYSLGCVLYEMLAGHPPFTGTNAQEVMARHSLDMVPPLRTGRATIPEPIEEALEKALAKVPADRFATAQAFSAALDIDPVAYRRRQRRMRGFRKTAVGVVGGVALSGALYGVGRYRAATDWMRVELDSNAVAVLPFAVRTADAQLAYLGEAVVDLFYNTVLTGDLGPRAVSPNALIPAWADRQERGEASDPDAALRMAAHFSAGQLVEGSVVQAGPEVTLRGTLRDVPGGKVIAEEMVTGDPNAPHELVYRLAVRLMGARLGEGAERLASLAEQDTVAVREYLTGIRTYRAGNLVEALRHFDRAASTDTTFVLPFVRIALMGDNTWVAGESQDVIYGRLFRSARRAWTLQAELSRRDRAALEWTTVVYGIDTTTTGIDELRAARRWAELAPDDPDAMMVYASALWNVGALANVPDWEERFRAARARAWELDSMTPFRVVERTSHALMTGDREWIRRTAPVFSARVDSTTERWAGLRWGLAHYLGDSATVGRFRTRALQGDPRVGSIATFVDLLTATAHEAEIPFHDVLSLVDKVPPQVKPFIWLAAGRSQEAAAAMLQLGGWESMRLVELAYAYPGLDSAAAVAAESLQALSTRSAAMEEDPADWPGWGSPRSLFTRCAVELYRVLRGDTVEVREWVREAAPQFHEHGYLGICPTMVEAFLEHHDRSTSDAPALDRLEALIRQGTTAEFPGATALLAVARMRRDRGELQPALRAAADVGVRFAHFYRDFRAPYLKEEGALAAAVGDTARAIDAFSRYLNIRVAPDPGAVQAEADSVRGALEELRRNWRR